MTDDVTLTRELAGLREQLDDGELDAGDYAELRERLVLRAAAEASDASGQKRRRATGWRWAVGGLLAAAVVVATLVPAVRQRGAGDFPTGNDFSEERSQLDSGSAEWRAAERALRIGATREAIRRYRLAIAFLPERADLRARFGFALARDGSRDEALEQLRLAVRNSPDLPAARLYLGAVLLQAGRRAEARKHWRRYLELAPRGRSAEMIRRTLRTR